MSDSTTDVSSRLWLQKIKAELLEIANIPRPGTRFTFPFDSFTDLFSHTFQLEGLKISLGLCEWKTQENYLSGLGKSPVSFAGQLTPLEGSFFWLMPYEDVTRIVGWLRDEEKNPFQIDHPDLLKGIYRFLFLEALGTARHLQAFDDLSPKVLENQKFDPIGYTMDVSIKKGEDSLWGRLILSKELLTAFENHFAIKKPTLESISDLPSLQIPLSISLGSTFLSKTELDSLKEGDFVILDNAYYKPREDRINYTILLKNTPLFQVKYREGKMKIFDFVYAHQESDYAE